MSYEISRKGHRYDPLMPSFQHKHYYELWKIKATATPLARPKRPSLYVRRHGFVDCHGGVWTVSLLGWMVMRLWLQKLLRESAV